MQCRALAFGTLRKERQLTLGHFRRRTPWQAHGRSEDAVESLKQIGLDCFLLVAPPPMICKARRLPLFPVCVFLPPPPNVLSRGYKYTSSSSKCGFEASSFRGVMLWHDRVEDVLTRCDRRAESLRAVHVSEAACEFGVEASNGGFPKRGSYHYSLYISLTTSLLKGCRRADSNCLIIVVGRERIC